MTHEQAYDLASLDGFTYDGFVQRQLTPHVDTGFVVAYKGITFNNWDGLNNLVRMGIILAFSAVYEDKIIGGWHDGAADIYYLDVCTIRAFKSDALEVARSTNQKAIFSLHTNEVISVN